MLGNCDIDWWQIHIVRCSSFQLSFKHSRYQWNMIIRTKLWAQKGAGHLNFPIDSSSSFSLFLRLRISCVRARTSVDASKSIKSLPLSIQRISQSISFTSVIQYLFLYLSRDTVWAKGEICLSFSISESTQCLCRTDV